MAVFVHFFSLMSINTTDHSLLKKQRNGLRNLQPVRKYQLHQLRCLLIFNNMFTMPIGPRRIPLGFQSHNWSTKLDDCKAAVLYDNHGYLAIDWIGLQVVQAINYNTYNFWKKYIYIYIYFFMNRRACNSNLLSLHHYTLWQKQNLKKKGKWIAPFLQYYYPVHSQEQPMSVFCQSVISVLCWQIVTVERKVYNVWQSHSEVNWCWDPGGERNMIIDDSAAGF